MEGVILVVAVDRTRREALQTALRVNGVTAIVTSSELRALELLRHGSLFDAVAVEPGQQSGSEMSLTMQIQRLRPELPIVTVSSDDLPPTYTPQGVYTEYGCSFPSASPNSVTATLRSVVKRLLLERERKTSPMPEPAPEALLNHQHCLRPRTPNST